MTRRPFVDPRTGPDGITKAARSGPPCAEDVGSGRGEHSGWHVEQFFPRAHRKEGRVGHARQRGGFAFEHPDQRSGVPRRRPGAPRRPFTTLRAPPAPRACSRTLASH